MQTMFLESMLKGIHARMSVVTSRNVLMTSIMVCYIPKVLEIKPAAPETINYCRIPVIMTGDYLVITFGYLRQGNEGFWVDADFLCQHIDIGKTDGLSIIF